MVRRLRLRAIKQPPCAFNGFVIQIYSAFHLRHGFYEARPVLFRKALVTAEAGHQTDVADVVLRIILGGWCPARNDVPNAAEPVLYSIGAEQAEGSPKTPFHRDKLTKDLLPPGGAGGGYLALPSVT